MALVTWRADWVGRPDGSRLGGRTGSVGRMGHDLAGGLGRSAGWVTTWRADWAAGANSVDRRFIRDS